MTITSGTWNMEMMMRAFDGLPVNVGLLGKGNSSGALPIVEQINAGAGPAEGWRALFLPSQPRSLPPAPLALRRP